MLTWQTKMLVPGHVAALAPNPENYRWFTLDGIKRWVDTEPQTPAGELWSGLQNNTVWLGETYETTLVTYKETTKTVEQPTTPSLLLELLTTCGGVNTIVARAASKTPEFDTISEADWLYETRVTAHGGTKHSIEIEIPTGYVCWPTELGGTPLWGETRRLLTVTTNHANWRTRRSRRITEFTIRSIFEI